MDLSFCEGLGLSNLCGLLMRGSLQYESSFLGDNSKVGRSKNFKTNLERGKGKRWQLQHHYGL